MLAAAIGIISIGDELFCLAVEAWLWVAVVSLVGACCKTIVVTATVDAFVITWPGISLDMSSSDRAIFVLANVAREVTVSELTSAGSGL